MMPAKDLLERAIRYRVENPAEGVTLPPDDVLDDMLSSAMRGGFGVRIQCDRLTDGAIQWLRDRGYKVEDSYRDIAPAKTWFGRLRGDFTYTEPPHYFICWI